MISTIYNNGRVYKVVCEDELIAKHVSALRTSRDICYYIEEAIENKISHRPSEVFQTGWQIFPFYQWDFGGKFDGKDTFYITQL